MCSDQRRSGLRGLVRHRRPTRRWTLRLLAGFVVSSLLASACGSGDGETVDDQTDRDAADQAIESGDEPIATAAGRLPEDFWEHFEDIVPNSLVTEAHHDDVVADIVAFCSFLETSPESIDQVIDEADRIGAQRADELGQPYDSEYAGVLAGGIGNVCPDGAASYDALIAETGPSFMDQVGDEEIQTALRATWEKGVGPATRWSTFPNEVLTLELFERWTTEICEVLESTKDADAARDTARDRFVAHVPDASELEQDAVTAFIVGLSVTLTCPESSPAE